MTIWSALAVHGNFEKVRENKGTFKTTDEISTMALPQIHQDKTYNNATNRKAFLRSHPHGYHSEEEHRNQYWFEVRCTTDLQNFPRLEDWRGYSRRMRLQSYPELDEGFFAILGSKSRVSKIRNLAQADISRRLVTMEILGPCIVILWVSMFR